MLGEAWQDHLSLRQNGRDPSDKRGVSKWVLQSSLDGWQGPTGSYQ